MGIVTNSFPNADVIREQLLRILNSFEFQNSQVLSRFLQFVVEEALGGRSNEIKEYTIGVRALGRPVDFNPQVDAAVRIHAGRLRRILHEYYNNKGRSDLVFIDIPKGSYVPSFDLDHQKVEAPINKEEEIASADTKVAEAKKAKSHKATVAVFPFHNLGADNTKNYFVEGIGEQLCTDLARFQHLSTISYYSTFELAKENKSIAEIQKIFDIDYIISGSIRFLDGLVQLNVQLVLAKTETLLWTKTYLRHFNEDNLYSLQDDIIEHVLSEFADYDGIITKNIVQTLSSGDKNGYGVYEAVYRYYNFIGQHDFESFLHLKAALEQAAVIDPENSLVWALLSKLALYNYISTPTPSFENLERGKAYAEKALLLDHYCQHSYQAVALAHLLSGRTEECAEAIERCIALNNKSLYMTGLAGFMMICVGKYARGLQLLLKAFHQNSVLPWYCNLGFALYYYHDKKFDQALGWIYRAVNLEIPLVFIVRLALLAEISNYREIKELEASTPEVLDNSDSFLKQFILDEELRKQLLHSLKLAESAK